MPEKPGTASGYTPEHLELVRSTCLYVATKLGDLMEELVIVGGLAPSLLIDHLNLPDGADSHVGTTDLDVGLTVALLDEERYAILTERLRDIQPDFAALIAPGLHLAFLDRRRVTLSGKTFWGEEATRDVWVCGAGAYIVLKALAFRDRGENKDAYDLFYAIRNFGVGVSDVADAVRPLMDDPSAVRAAEILEQDSSDHDAVGPRRVAEFLTRRPDDAIQADAAGFVRELLALLQEG